MENNILKDLNIFVCRCGVLLQLDALKLEQVKMGKLIQEYYCPVCNEKLYIEDKK